MEEEREGQSDSAERVRRHRAKKVAFDAGYALEPGTQFVNNSEQLTEWARGVWRRKAEAQQMGAEGKQEAQPRPEKEKKQRR